MAEKANASTEEAKTTNAEEKKSSSKITIPSVKDMFTAGVQFGHETKRWNPKMKKFIHSSKNNIHIIDITKTVENLDKAVKFLEDASSRGSVLFVGTKRQSSEIIRNHAVDCGAYFVDIRWAGGILTNFKEVKKSLIKLKNLERMFEDGVEGRTKYEISRMKKEWARLSRLYSGIKDLDQKPTALVIVDSNYEKGALREAKILGIPVVAMADTNTDPELVQYVIPANDDALGSIELVISTLAEAVKAGNKGKGVKHNLKDYSKVEVNIIKSSANDAEFETEAVDSNESNETVKVSKTEQASSRKSTGGKSKGILERVQESKEKKTK